MNKPVVYRICLPDGTFYVGSAKDLDKRMAAHASQLRCGNHHNVHLQERYDRGELMILGHETFETREEAFAAEQTYIDLTPDELLLNIGRSVQGGDNLTHNPNRADILMRIGKSHRETYQNMSPEDRIKLHGQPGEKNGMFGRTHTEETRERLRQLSSTPERIAAQRARRLGVVASAETRSKISEAAKLRTGDKNPFYGRHHSEETKRKLAIASAGRLPPNMCEIVIGDKHYPSLAQAARELGVVIGTVRHRLMSKNPKFNGYRYVVEGPTTSKSVERNDTDDE